MRAWLIDTNARTYTNPKEGDWKGKQGMRQIENKRQDGRFKNISRLTLPVGCQSYFYYQIESFNLIVLNINLV